MNKGQSRQSRQPIQIPLIKVNEIINSIFAMNQGTVVEQLEICSKMGGQLLQNELINDISSLKSAKLLCYELVLMIAEVNFVEGYSKISSFENSCRKNRNFEFSTSMRRTLAEIDELLKDLIWNENSNKRGGTKKHIVSSPIDQAYAEFKNLVSDFETLAYGQEKSPILKSSIKRVNLEGDWSEENEALIEQLEEIISKKEKRIKEMTEELEEFILEQKGQEDLITELQNTNIDLHMQVTRLNNKLCEIENSEVDLQSKVRSVLGENSYEDFEFNEKNFKIGGLKVMKTNYTDEHEEEKTQHKQPTFRFEETTFLCSECQSKNLSKQEEFCSLSAMLLTQALSIEALII